jgi:uncharacterized membrane protein YadS
MHIQNPVAGLLPGVFLCVGITLVASVLQVIEQRLTGEAYIEALVLAILIGVAVRTLWRPGALWFPGIQFSAKLLLEFAVMLLGVSVSARTVLAIGPQMLAGIVATVAVAIAASYGVSRALGLPQRMAILVAWGNSICGNSAIAAVAQVLAATLPIGALANQVGTVVKLVRVLMLGPVVLALSLMTCRLRDEADETAPRVTAGERPKRGRPALHQLVPWFIVAFLVVATLRSLGLIPALLLAPTTSLASALTTVSMAALGLGVRVSRGPAFECRWRSHFRSSY